MLRSTRISAVAGIGVALALLVCLTNCTPTGSIPGPIDSNVVGLSAGGQQDIARARSDIQAGYVPDPNTIAVAGFLAEHDIPLTAPADAPEIYVSTGIAWRKSFGESAGTAEVFLRLGSSIDVSSFHRAPQNLAVVVDRSGSMNDIASSTDYRSKLDAVKEALHSLVNQLDGGDQLSIIVFNDKVQVSLKPTRGDDPDPINQKIDDIQARGNTNLFDAIKLGFETLAESSSAERVNRLIVFTDAQPTAGPTGSAEFLGMQRTYAEQGFGFTLMGVGANFGDDLARDISSVRGGNSFYLSSSDRIAQVFNDEFDYFVTPAAYDLVLRVQVPDGVGIRDVYGVPDYVPGSRGAEIRIPTLFSAREGGGAIVVRLTFTTPPVFDAPVTIGQGTLSYTLATGVHRDLAQELVLPQGSSPSGDPAYYSDEAVRRAALLLDTALVLQSAAKAGRDGRQSDGAALIQDFLADFSARSQGMSDRTNATSRSLSDERALLERMQGVLESGGYYPYYY